MRPAFWNLTMTYSCNQFSEDIVRCLIDAEVVDADSLSDPDVGRQADVAIAGIVAAGQATRAARFISLVLASDESRAALAATGDGAFADALSLADAISSQCVLELPPARAMFAAFVAALPHGREWAKQMALSH
ncbi:hypothetical protein M3A49_39405 [Paraburkholderia sp. CNPSo 3076]|uniref:hypothetical protein n=1 Tax=Paraburkholderia sp. CNPSo 3076 TaxID=2940936 RepID=UPI00225A7AD4|nr:hypothetical protein [Paraburkholderia sp. CNPSo 3076]MCX5545429.1 hypothetical protein [Paraburkholderia sp. CNPSo 3076]